MKNTQAVAPPMLVETLAAAATASGVGAGLRLLVGTVVVVVDESDDGVAAPGAASLQVTSPPISLLFRQLVPGKHGPLHPLSAVAGAVQASPAPAQSVAGQGIASADDGTLPPAH